MPKGPDVLPDVLVVGSGPAGLALAAALGETGLRVVVLAPDPYAPWPNTYGVWLDEVEPLGYTPYLSHIWENTVVNTGQGDVQLGRTYARFDNAALQAHLLARCERCGVTLLKGVAAEAEHSDAGSSLHTHDGLIHKATLVIDASGHGSRRVTRPPSAPAFQTAFGVVGHFSAPPTDRNQMMLMDFRDDFLSEGERRTPTFLYAMDLGEGRFLAEETSLAQRPGLTAAILQDRLERRLAARGITVHKTVALENVRFPMNPPLPDLGGRVVGFGGAASMVHPASGYMVALALRRAPELAKIIAASLGEEGTSPRRAATAAWNALWPSTRQRQRQLYLFGLDALMSLDSPQTRSFFNAFFKLSPKLWQGYLSDTLPLSGTLLTMLGMFQHAPNSVRLPLMREALTALGSSGRARP